MIVAETRAELRAAREKLASPVVLVPTMGALHDGHRALLRRARELAGSGGTVAVSIFVNPLQFGPNEDLDQYPRTLDADLAACEDEGVGLVFAPSVGEMYPQEQLVKVDPGPTGEILEGEFRPGFFQGVLTVVLKIFSLVRPDTAVFGQKDAQQLVLVRRMSADFGLGIEIEAVPTVRAADGLALSSRNKYLSPEERAVAPVLYRALATGAAAASGGPGAVLAAAQAVLDDAARALPAGAPPRVDYLALADGRSYAVIAAGDAPSYPPAARPLAKTAIVSGAQESGHGFSGTAVLAIAARVGTTRLIDNVLVQLSPGGTTPRSTPGGAAGGLDRDRVGGADLSGEVFPLSPGGAAGGKDRHRIGRADTPGEASARSFGGAADGMDRDGVGGADIPGEAIPRAPRDAPDGKTASLWDARISPGETIPRTSGKGPSSMLLTIDIGNTNMVLGVFDGDMIVEHWRIATVPDRTADEIAALLHGLLARSTVVKESDLAGISLCSTVPSVLHEMREMVRRYYPDVPAVIVQPGVKTGVPIRMDNPKEVGSDRIMNSLAAVYLYGGPAIVVDFGTSTNFDAVSAKGEFVGGALAPGIEISVDALSRRAAQLLKVELTRPPRVIGKNTVEALQSGIVYGFAGQVEGIARRMALELSPEDPGAVTVIATGGLAPLVIDEVPIIDAHEPWLTLIGLRLVWEKTRHHIGPATSDESHGVSGAAVGGGDSR